MKRMKTDTSLYLNKIVDLFRQLFEDRLIGIYLHGSLAMGCFHPDRSDIDFLVILKEKPDEDTYRELARAVLRMADDMPELPDLEFSVLLESAVKPFTYPTPFEFHYSPLHREKYRQDANYRCGGFADEDLAAHLTIAYYRGIALYGRPLRELYEPVDALHYTSSILNDVKDAIRDILVSPLYMTLNLCRVLYYLKEGAISSKKEGGEWAVQVVPDRYKALIRRCLDEYSGVSAGLEAETPLLPSFAEYMLTEINRSLKERESPGNRLTKE